MVQRQPAPTSLKVVAVLFILGGLSSAIDVLLRLMQGSIFLNLGVLGLMIGPGLLRYSRGWRTCALVFLGLGMIGFPLAIVLMLATDQPLRYSVFGQEMGEMPKGTGIVLAVLFFTLSLWPYWVLTRPSVRQLYGIPADSGAAADGGA